MPYAPTIANRVRRFSINVPAAASAAASLLSLIGESNFSPGDLANIVGGQINPTSADYLAGDSASSLPITVASPDAYTEPSADFIRNTFVRAASGGAIAASVSVWLTGDGRLGLG